MPSKKAGKTIDSYIAGFPKEIQSVLQKIRGVVRKTAPGAEETISYPMPTFKLNGTYLVYFAAWKNHIALYPTPSATGAFKKELAPYSFAKGSVRFPLDKPLPYGLIKKIVAYRVKESKARLKNK